MARGFSKAIITGNITKDPEMRSVSTGTQVCSFSVAVNRNFRASDGTSKESVSFIDCVAWGKAAEIICQYAKRGTAILVSGRLEQHSYETKEGQKRSRTEVIVEDFNFLSGRAEGGNSNYNSDAAQEEATDVVPDDVPAEPIDLNDVPF